MIHQTAYQDRLLQTHRILGFYQVDSTSHYTLHTKFYAGIFQESFRHLSQNIPNIR